MRAVVEDLVADIDAIGLTVIRAVWVDGDVAARTGVVPRSAMIFVSTLSASGSLP
jgi:hypothetical protein